MAQLRSHALGSRSRLRAVHSRQSHVVQLIAQRGCRVKHMPCVRLQRQVKLVVKAVAAAAEQEQSGPRPNQVPYTDDDVAFYTPAQFVVYSEEPENKCVHELEVVVNADVEKCFNTWNDWQGLVNFFDLIGQVGLDESTPHLALFQCFYQWKTLPILEITFALSKTEVVPNKHISFKAIYGMPLEGKVEFTPLLVDGTTKVAFRLEHDVPLQLIDHAGKMSISADIEQILCENLLTFKSLMEADTDSSENIITAEDCWHPPPDVTEGAELIDRVVTMMEDAEQQATEDTNSEEK